MVCAFTSGKTKTGIITGHIINVPLMLHHIFLWRYMSTCSFGVMPSSALGVAPSHVPLALHRHMCFWCYTVACAFGVASSPVPLAYITICMFGFASSPVSLKFIYMHVWCCIITCAFEVHICTFGVASSPVPLVLHHHNYERLVLHHHLCLWCSSS